MTPEQDIDRLYELLVDRATVGLTPAEQAELEVLRAAFPDVDADTFDRAAAAAELTVLDRTAGEFPLELMSKLEADAAEFFRHPTTPATAPSPDSPRLQWLAFSGWAVAVCLLVAVVWQMWQKRQPTVAERRDTLLRTEPARYGSAPAVVNVPVGEVVWSGTKQEGYLELRGLTPNDPARSQYQLWVVDKGRPGQPPVDGGVFDVRPDGTALVPIRTPVPVREAAAFAVTVEPPGGVVVSEDGKVGKFVVLMTPTP